MNKFPLTVRGAEKMRAELKELKTVARPKVIQAISDAREHGDLKENAEYHAAREQQSFLEGRIGNLEGKLGNSQIIDVFKLEQDGRVVFGVTVELLNVETDEEVCYQIVGEDESNVEKQRISITSPIARALIGKEEGEEVAVRTPGGVVDYEILAVKYL
jgi:transcription elongation factor GreA